MMRIAISLLLLLGSAATARAASPRAPLTLTYLGVAGWSISDGHHTIVLDPLFSRPADTEHPRVDERAVAAHTPAHVDLILVGHAHYDHDMDAPLMARRTGAPLMGSAQVIAKARAAGLKDEQLRLVQGGEDLELDGFSVRVIPSLHSRTGLQNGDDVQTFAYLVRLGGQQLLLFDTANFIERELVGLHPDVLVAAPGLREKIHDYSCRLMTALGQPRVVLVTHFDNHKKPATAAPLSADERAELQQFGDELKRCAPATRLVVPQPFVPWSVPAR